VLATEAEDRERLKYTSLAAMYCFVPITIETMGALGDDALDFMHQLDHRIASVTGKRRSTEFLVQWLSVAFSGATQRLSSELLT